MRTSQTTEKGSPRWHGIEGRRSSRRVAQVVHASTQRLGGSPRPPCCVPKRGKNSSAAFDRGSRLIGDPFRFVNGGGEHCQMSHLATYSGFLFAVQMQLQIRLS